MRSAAVLVAVLAASAPAAPQKPAGTVPRATAPAARRPAAGPDRDTLLKQASEAQQAGDAARALRLLQQAIERYESVRACIELARLQTRLKQPAAAMETLTKAREIAPNSEDVLSAYAQLALATKQPMPAVLALMTLARIYPSAAQYHYLLGVGLMAIGDMGPASDALEQANRLEPDKPLTLLALGLAMNNRKLFAEAKTALTRSLELQPGSNEATAALAEAEAGLGDFEPATTHAREALAAAPANATAHLVLGLAAMERRNYQQARDSFLQANQADPESPKVLYQLSLAFARLGDEASARRYVALYQEKLRSVEERIKILRTGGTSATGTSPR